jgi:Phosphotransferase enzyme family
VTLVLLDPAGDLLGALAPFEVSLPWWQDVTEVIAAARSRCGATVSILRLLAADRPAPPGGAVTYLAQLAEPGSPVRSGRSNRWVPSGRRMPSMLSIPDDIEPTTFDPHPNRALYAQPCGPANSLHWAAGALAGIGHPPVLATAQQRTWGLSAIWRLDTAAGPVWLKQVPSFFGHEAGLLAWLGTRGWPVPRLLAADRDARMLLADVPGEDWYAATPADRRLIAADMHGIQLAAADSAVELIAAGVPDWRADRLAPRIRKVLARHAADLPTERLAQLLAELPGRLAAVAQCGLPDTLVHGDLHPGNVRFDGQRRTLLDWGDAFVGHPGFDILRLVQPLGPADRVSLVQAWAARWRDAVPGSQPEHAVSLLAPIAALRNACVYADFLDRIEPAEHPYHRADVPYWLGEAVAAAQLS